MRADLTTKVAWRAALLAERVAMSAEARAADARALSAHLFAAVSPGSTIGAYVPVGSEPGSLAALDALVTANVRVLLPIARSVTGSSRPLAWSEYRTGGLVDAPFGLSEPDGERLAPDAIGAASIVFVPALAVDRVGSRLGRGAGFYDRSLHLVDPAALLVAVVRDDELVARLPAEAHDVPMTHAMTPRHGLVALGHRTGREWPRPPGGSST